MTNAPGESDAVVAIGAAVAEHDLERAAAIWRSNDLAPDATRELFGQLGAADAAGLVAALADDVRAREVLLWMPGDVAASIVSALDTALAARLVGGLPSDERADLLAALPDRSRADIQHLLPPATQAETSSLLKYLPGTAGGLMETEFLAFPSGSTVSEAIRDIRSNQQKYAEIGVQYLYLVDDARHLVGVAPIRDLMLASEDAPLSSLIKSAPAMVRDDADTHALASAFEDQPFMALPVVDAAGTLLGVVNRADATEREHEEAEDDYRVSQGIVGGEELRSMPVATRWRRRGAWLAINLLMCLGGAGVIAWHQDTIAKVIVVAAVLPVISATSGNAAMQAAAVSIRELTLGVIGDDARTAWRRVLMHELLLAVLLAAPLGAAVAVLSRAWGAPWTIGAAVGLAMSLNAVISISIGGLAPLVLRRVRVDPALASGPISTTVADITGFALTLTFVGLAA
ncbi:MAG: magnesium transporter MgtE [Phycisphaerae bacterium]